MEWLVTLDDISWNFKKLTMEILGEWLEACLERGFYIEYLKS